MTVEFAHNICVYLQIVFSIWFQIIVDKGIGKPVILLMPVSVVRWRNFQDYLVSCHTCLLSLNTSFQWNKEMTGLPFIGEVWICWCLLLFLLGSPSWLKFKNKKILPLAKTNDTAPGITNLHKFVLKFDFFLFVIESVY